MQIVHINQVEKPSITHEVANKAPNAKSFAHQYGALEIPKVPNLFTHTAGDSVSALQHM